MLKLMIVDDEAVIRNGIEKVVDWTALDIEIVGEASNGRDALNRALVLHPDIVVTDIKMPIISGIDFARELLKRRPDTCVVLLTGYSDFSYMQQAIQIGVVDYLLKPIRVDELEKLMRRLTMEIKIRREEKMRQIATQQVMARNLPIMRGALLWDFLTKHITAETFEKRAKELGISLSGPIYTPIALDIDDWKRLPQSENQNASLRYSVLNIAEELFGSLGNAAFGYLTPESSLLGIVCSEDVSPDAIVETCSQIQFYTQRFFRFTVTAAIGSCVKTIDDFRLCAKQACSALDRKIYTGKNQVIQAGDFSAAKNNGAILLARQDEEALKESIMMAKNLDAQKKLDEIFDKYFSDIRYTRKAVRQFGLTLILVALRALSDEQISPEDAFGQDSLVVEEIEKYETLDEMRLFVKNVYSRAIRSIESKQDNNYRLIVRDAIEYVQQHYAESIYVSDVAAAVYVTPNYFSKIFKQETGENFTEWLNKFRIEKAKTLMLQQSGDKVYEIASKVGFHDYKYFAFIFKKYSGYTPGTFKKLNH